MLTNEEIDLLQAGLDSLETRDAAGELVGSLMCGLMARTEEQQEKLSEMMAERAEKKRVQQQRLVERVVLLKAKLIQMKDDAEIERIMATTANPGTAKD